MTLKYRRHFPNDWTDEKVLECVTEIVTNPQNYWKQITGKHGCLFRPIKYVVDGMYEGKIFRVFLEPEKRWVLTAYEMPSDR